MKTKYIGVKILESAELMTKAEYCKVRGWDVPSDEDPNEQVYLVEYEPTENNASNHVAYSGYISMSPKDVFEEAYRPTTGMTFGLAVEAMKKGNKIARAGWNGKDMFVVYSPGSTDLPADRFFTPALKDHAINRGGTMTVRPCMMLKTAQDDVAYWSPSGSDALAEDWIIVD